MGSDPAWRPGAARDLWRAAAFLIAILAPLVPTACPSVHVMGFGGGGSGTGGMGGAGGVGPGFGGFTHGGAGTVGPGGFGLGGGFPKTVSSTTSAAGCLGCAMAVQQGGAGVCPGLPSDAYAALGACACVGTCAAKCGDTLCKQGPAGVACGACVVSTCPDQQADCAVN